MEELGGGKSYYFPLKVQYKLQVRRKLASVIVFIVSATDNTRRNNELIKSTAEDEWRCETGYNKPDVIKGDIQHQPFSTDLILLDY